MVPNFSDWQISPTFSAFFFHFPVCFWVLYLTNLTKVKIYLTNRVQLKIREKKTCLKFPGFSSILGKMAWFFQLENALPFYPVNVGDMNVSKVFVGPLVCSSSDFEWLSQRILKPALMHHYLHCIQVDTQSKSDWVGAVRAYSYWGIAIVIATLLEMGIIVLCGTIHI